MKLLPSQSIKILAIIASLLLCTFSISLSYAETSATSPKLSITNLDKQLNLLDSEILLLKAELAMQNNEMSQVKNYLLALASLSSNSQLTEQMLQRLSVLKQSYISTILSSPIINSATKQFNPTLKKIVVLLPQTGAYAEVSEAIVEGLSTIFSEENISYFDTESYSSMFDLWELVKLYNPSVVIGPLQKKNVNQFNQLDVGVPTLYFNDVENGHTYTHSLSLSRLSHVDLLISHLVENNVKNITVLSNKSSFSRKLTERFSQKWQAYQVELATENNYLTAELSLPFNTVYYEVKDSIDQAMRTVLNEKKSLIRKNWLQKTVGTDLFYTERVRQDIEVVISFLNNSQALQVTPMLQFFKLNYIEHVWLPSRLPESRSFIGSLPYWSDTLAIFPTYFKNSVRLHIQEKPNDFSAEDVHQLKIGTFHALGKLAAEIIEKVATENTFIIQSELGKVSFDREQAVVVPASLVWISKGSIHVQ